jgi:hypothetical protein
MSIFVVHAHTHTHTLSHMRTHAHTHTHTHLLRTCTFSWRTRQTCRYRSHYCITLANPKDSNDTSLYWVTALSLALALALSLSLTLFLSISLYLCVCMCIPLALSHSTNPNPYTTILTHSLARSNGTVHQQTAYVCFTAPSLLLYCCFTAEGKPPTDSLARTFQRYCSPTDCICVLISDSLLLLYCCFTTLSLAHSNGTVHRQTAYVY